MTHSSDKNRRNQNLLSPTIDGALPSHFAEQYGQDSGSLIKFLDLYYQFLDSSGVNSFGSDIHNLFTARDISETNAKGLDQLIGEIGNGLTASAFFQQPRLMARLLAQFYRSKGTLVSVEGFFRGFFNQEVTIEHPKDKLLFVGGKDSSGIQGQIGFDYNHRTVDNGEFQIFSVKVKAGVSNFDYEKLYKKFAHPAGFNFTGQLVTDGVATISLIGTGIDPLEEDDNIVLATPLGDGEILAAAGFNQMTAIFDSVGDNGDPNIAGVFRSTLSDFISKYQSITVGNLIKSYGTIDKLFDPDSFTFDDSATGLNAATSRIDMSFTTETMDNDMFTRYLSDSAI